MFQEACAGLKGALIPVVLCLRNSDGEVGCGMGAGILINQEGWFITAAHLLMMAKEVEVATKNQAELPGFGQVTNHVCVLGVTGARLGTARVFHEIDLGIAKLKNYTHRKELSYPKLRVRDVQQGEMLCRIGFPFVGNVKPKWNNGVFDLSGIFPVPQFVNEALVSRFAKLSEGTWIETSSPGLKGQSGGPLLDVDGLVCGIQVNTCSYPLNFEGAERDQVFNVGRAVHIETIRMYLDDNNIQYQTEVAP